MNLAHASFAPWFIHSAVGGGLLLLLTSIAMRWTTQPARRQRIGELGVAAALIVALLSLAPAWLVFSVPVAVVELPAQPTVQPALVLVSVRDGHPTSTTIVGFEPVVHTNVSRSCAMATPAFAYTKSRSQ